MGNSENPIEDCNSIEEIISIIKDKLFDDETEHRLYYESIQGLLEDQRFSPYAKLIIRLSFCDRIHEAGEIGALLKNIKKEKFSPEQLANINRIRGRIQKNRQRIFDRKLYTECYNVLLGNTQEKSGNTQEKSGKAQEKSGKAQEKRGKAQEKRGKAKGKRGEKLKDLFRKELEELEAKINNSTNSFRMTQRDLMQLQKIAEIPVEDIRAKMQLVMLFRKYGMREIADERLSKESRIFDDIKAARNLGNTTTEIIDELSKSYGPKLVSYLKGMRLLPAEEHSTYEEPSL